MEDIKYWLWLSFVFGNSNRRIWQIMCTFESVKEAYEEISSPNRIFELTEKEEENLNSVSLNRVEEIIEECRKKGIGIIKYNSEKYPTQLKYILNPPLILYYKGNIDCLSNNRSITCVGTRHPSDYSLYAARNICSKLAEKGMLTVSGFAVGIDIESHLASVSKNMPTVCVMGCGLDVDYPRDNFKYRDKIIDAGGLFLSEFDIGVQANGYNFPKRNRVLSALGTATIVFEASIKSGALITAGFAFEQGKELFCIPPHDIFSGEYSGNIKLLKEGAVPVFSADDIINCLNKKNQKNSAAADKLPEKTRKNKIKSDTIRNNTNETNNKGTDNLLRKEETPRLCGIQNEIVKLMSDGAVHADVIAQKLNLNTTELMAELTELEIIGAVKSLPGKMFEKK